MNSARQVDEQIRKMKSDGWAVQDIAWWTARLCEGWTYVFGAWGAYCTPEERREFVDTVFDLLASTNARSFAELTDEKLRSLCGLKHPVRLVVTLGYAAEGDPLRPKKRKALTELVTEL